MGTGVAAESCDACLRRGALLGVLAPRIQAVLDARRRAPRAVLALTDHELIAAVGGRDCGAARFLEEFDARAMRHAMHERGVAAVCRHARGYPSRLSELADPPAVLFGVGRLEQALRLLADTPPVALVGTRRASPYGLEMSRSLGRGLGAAGVVVVSGLALGIDAAAHQGCLEADGFPVAVLGGGADVPYPRTNRGLYERIARRGAVISEMPPGHEPFRWGFPARNRIMAGLGEVTVVVEAAPRSGSLITTECATDLGRVVAAVPGQATNQQAQGSNELLRSGASVVTDVRDVLDELFGVGHGVAASARSGDVGGECGPPGAAPGSLDAKVLDGIGRDLGLDAICAESGEGVAAVRATLARLEGARLVHRDGFGRYRVRAAVP